MASKTIGIVVGGLLVAGAAFAGGYVLSGANSTPSGDPRAAFAQLSEAERQSLQTMTAEERQAFFEEKGIDAPARGAMGGPGGAGGPGGGPDGDRVLEGSVQSVDGDKITLTLTEGGSAKVYLDESTVRAAVEGKDADVAAGATVTVVATEEAEGVTAASLVVVR